MMTSSAIVDISRMAKYTNRRSVTYTHTQRKKTIENDVSYVISVQHTSFDWNSFVTAKNVSVASVEFRGVPYRRKKYEAIHIHHTNDVSWITPLNYTVYGTVSRYVVASFPGLHAQLLSLAVRKAGEGLDGLIT